MNIFKVNNASRMTMFAKQKIVLSWPEILASLNILIFSI